MAIRKRGSRTVVVDGTSYLWRVRPRPTYEQHVFAGLLTVAIQRADCSGAVLVVSVDRPRPDHCLEPQSSSSPPLMPAEVASVVRQAINAGWRPETPGPQFTWKPAASGK